MEPDIKFIPTEEDEKLAIMQKQIDDLILSMHSVRRKLFADMSEIKTLIAAAIPFSPTE
jgi:histidinol phosphatase-like PHP family hydrolase